MKYLLLLYSNKCQNKETDAALPYYFINKTDVYMVDRIIQGILYTIVNHALHRHSSLIERNKEGQLP